MWGRRLVRDERQLKMVDDPVDHREIRNEGDDAHLAAAFGAGHRVHFINLADHLGPAPPGNLANFLLNDQELRLPFLCLSHFAPMGIGVEAGLC